MGGITGEFVDIGLKSPTTVMTVKPRLQLEFRTRHANYMSLGPIYLGATYWTPDTKNVWNQIIGGMGRICIDTPSINDCLMAEYHCFVKILYDLYLVPRNIQPMDYDDFMDNHPYYTLEEKFKFKELNKIMEDATECQLFDSLTVQSFLKLEFYDSKKKPRWINPRTDEFKSMVGNIVHTMDEVIYDCFSEFHVKHMNNSMRRDKLIRKFGKLAVTTTDFTSWEATVKSELMNCTEIELLKRLFSDTVPAHKLAFIIYAWTGIQTCVTTAGVKMHTEAQRQSGEVTTSGFNFLTDMTVTLFSYYKQFFLEKTMVQFISEMSQLVPALFEGDDGIHRCGRGVLTADTYVQLGLIAKMEYHETLNTASFCGQVFSFEEDVVITNPIKVILKFGWANIKYYGIKNKLPLIIAKAYSFAYQYMQCPIIYPVCKNIVDNYADVAFNKQTLRKLIDPYKIEQIALGKQLPPVNIELGARNFMAQVMGISESDQIAIEEELISCGINQWHSSTMDNYIHAKFRGFWKELVRYEGKDYLEIDDRVRLH